MARAQEPTADEVAALAQQIASRYQPPPTGGWSEIGNEDTIEALLRATAQGLKPYDACLAAGISTDSLKRWMQRAEADGDNAETSPYASLAQALKVARAQGKSWHLANIQRHALKEWTASAWTLERTDPEQFALRKDNSDTPKVVVQIGAGAGDVKVGVLVTTGETQQPIADPFGPSPSVSVDMHSLSAEQGGAKGNITPLISPTLERT